MQIEDQSRYDESEENRTGVTERSLYSSSRILFHMAHTRAYIQSKSHKFSLLLAYKIKRRFVKPLENKRAYAYHRENAQYFRMLILARRDSLAMQKQQKKEDIENTVNHFIQIFIPMPLEVALIRQMEKPHIHTSSRTHTHIFISFIGLCVNVTRFFFHVPFFHDIAQTFRLFFSFIRMKNNFRYFTES